MTVNDKLGKVDSPRMLLALDGGGIRGIITNELEVSGSNYKLHYKPLRD